MTSNRDQYDYGSLLLTTVTNQEFADAARRPDEWVNAARPLRVGAYVLRARYMNGTSDTAQGKQVLHVQGLLFTALFLASLSLENVLKAALLVRRPEFAQDGKLKFSGSGHDLLRLAMEAGFSLDENETAFLRVSCNPCIVSFGRYPMGLSKSNAPGSYQLHTSAFRYFETIFVRAAETALREACNAADEHRVAELELLLRELGNDVPQATMMGQI